MAVDIKLPLTKEYILSKITQEQIFERYLGIYPDVSKTYFNPLREDNKAGCRFYYDNRNILKFKDFSQNWNWDCFNVVQHIDKCSFMEALKKISNDFNVDNIETLTVEQLNLFKPPTRIEIASINWDNKNAQYWKDIYIDVDTLRFFNVKPIKSYWLNGVRYNVGRGELAYAYIFSNNKIKLYFPERESGRFMQNSSYIIQGAEQLPETNDYVLYTKSYKDVISLYTFGITSCSPASEVVFLDQNDYSNHSKRFPIQFLLYDNDWVGKKNTVKIVNKYNDIIPLLFPTDMKKDFTDNLRKYGKQFMIDIIEDTKYKFL